MSDLTLLAILLAFCAGTVLVALLAAWALKLDRLAQALAAQAGVSISRTGATIAVGSASLAVLLGIVPATNLLGGWGASIACIAVLAALVVTSMSIVTRPKQQALASHEEQEQGTDQAAA
jgi:hypothetical protein